MITRKWEMANKETFKIKPIKDLLDRYVINNEDGTNNWIDPFAGNNSPAWHTNDLNPNTSAKSHMDALEFVNRFSLQCDGALHDPPYSLRQTKECYKGMGIDKLSKEESQDATFSRVKDALAKKIKPGGYAISFGWSTVGFGKERGFEIVEILLVCHGGFHNDTIVTVERKMQNTL